MGTEMELELESRSRPFFTAPAKKGGSGSTTLLPIPTFFVKAIEISQYKIVPYWYLIKT